MSDMREMQTWQTRVIGLVVLVAVTGLVVLALGLGGEVTAKAEKMVVDIGAAVGGEGPGERLSVEYAVTAEDALGARYEQALEEFLMPKTGVSKSGVFSCTVTLHHVAEQVAQHPGTFDVFSHTAFLFFEATNMGGKDGVILFTGPDPSDPWEFKEVDGNDEASWDITVSVSNLELHRDESIVAQAGRDSGPAYSKERHFTDSWVAGGSTVTTVTAGAVTLVQPGCGQATNWLAGFTANSWHTSFLTFTDSYITVSGIQFFDDMASLGLVDVRAPVGTVDPNRYLQMKGSGSSFVLQLPNGPYSSHPGPLSCGISAPLQVDFSGVSVRARDGAMLDDLLLWGNFVKSAHMDGAIAGGWPVKENGDPYAYGDSIPLTVAQIVGLGTWTQSVGNATGTQSGDNYPFWTPPLAFDIVDYSAKLHHLI